MTATPERPATAAIFHHPDAVESPDKPLAGRRTAGQSFLAGYARHVRAGALHCVAGNQAHIDHFKTLVTGFGWNGPVHGLLTQQPKTLAEPGIVFLPGPGVGAHAWPRRRAGQRTYSLCGITHTADRQQVIDHLGAAHVLDLKVRRHDEQRVLAGRDSGENACMVARIAA